MQRLVKAAAVAVLFSSLLSTVRAGQGDQPSREYRIKAAFLYNFTKFVQWPDRSFEHDESPIVIGVLGKDPFGKVLDKTVEGRQVRGRTLRIRRIEKAEEAGGCHVLFVSRFETEHLDEIFKELGNAPILTVGETPGFAVRGGTVNFVIEQEKVHFEINPDRSNTCDLKISSKLLKLARIVEDEE